MGTENEMPVILGLTGGIATGKSTVTSMFRELGVVVIDADAIAREVVQPGEPALDEIREAFGDEAFEDDGALDRKALGALVFSDRSKLATLSSITHPRIGQRMMERASSAAARGHRWVIYDAALLVENRMHTMFDALIVVSVSEETQMNRLLERDQAGIEDARARIASQLPLEDKVAVADYVIDNNNSLDETRAQVDALHAKIDAAIAAHGTAKPAR